MKDTPNACSRSTPTAPRRGCRQPAATAHPRRPATATTRGRAALPPANPAREPHRLGPGSASHLAGRCHSCPPPAPPPTQPTAGGGRGGRAGLGLTGGRCPRIGGRRRRVLARGGVPHPPTPSGRDAVAPSPRSGRAAASRPPLGAGGGWWPGRRRGCRQRQVYVDATDRRPRHWGWVTLSRLAPGGGSPDHRRGEGPSTDLRPSQVGGSGVSVAPASLRASDFWRADPRRWRGWGAARLLQRLVWNLARQPRLLFRRQSRAAWCLPRPGVSPTSRPGPHSQSRSRLETRKRVWGLRPPQRLIACPSLPLFHNSGASPAAPSPCRAVSSHTKWGRNTVAGHSSAAAVATAAAAWTPPPPPGRRRRRLAGGGCAAGQHPDGGRKAAGRGASNRVTGVKAPCTAGVRGSASHRQ